MRHRIQGKKRVFTTRLVTTPEAAKFQKVAINHSVTKLKNERKWK